MNRRKFIQRTSLTAFAISTTGFIKLSGSTYIGDCQTTTDILGPFYRPNAPVRTNLVIKDLPGEEVILKGRIMHDDCSTALEKAKVELWHCSAEEVYDNESDDYHYRGTTFCDKNGEYNFRTQMPVPYDAGGGNIRPAHFHLMISAMGYQNLITQLYFTGDPYLKKDASSNSPTAKSRILELQNDANGTLLVPFNVIMQKSLPADPATLHRLAGSYIDESDAKNTWNFFLHEDRLWLKNEVFGVLFNYVGNNTFSPSNNGQGSQVQIHFDILHDGKIRATRTRFRTSGEKVVRSALK